MRNLEFNAWAATELLGVYLCVYDVLLDDDEDVRDQGAVAASVLLSATASNDKIHNSGGITLTPSAASSKLLQYIVTEYKYSTVLWIDGVRRLTGAITLFGLEGIEAASNMENSLDSVEGPFTARNRASLQLRSVRNMLQEARQQDTALFVEEKANLYVDPVKEAKDWANALAELSPCSFEPCLVSEVAAWSIDGLSALIEIAESREDGPLGWTSEPDVYALGMKIILTGKVCIRFLSQQKTEEQSVVCLELLRKLFLVGKETFVHGLWLVQIQEIIGEVSS